MVRKILVIIGILVLLWVGWSAWPFVGLYDLARAAQSGDIERIEQRVDFASLGRSLSGQIVQTYARIAGLPPIAVRGTKRSLNALLKSVGLKYSDVDTVNLPFPDHVAALANKAVDASASVEPGPTPVRWYTAWLEMNRYRPARSPRASIACPTCRGT